MSCRRPGTIAVAKSISFHEYRLLALLPEHET